MGRPLTRRVVLAAAAVVCVLGVAAGLAERGQAAPGPVQLVSIGKFNQPTFVTAPPGDTARVFVVEKQGTVEVLHDGVVSKFLDITSRVTTSGTEQGLLSIAFDPNYATNGLLYADYTTKSPSGDLEIDEFHATGNAVDSGPRQVLLIPHIAAQNHNGGQLQFGPDGDLYIGTGDGGDEDDSLGNGQNPASLLAKILRIDPHQSGASAYTVPTDNPEPSGLRPGWAPEVYAMGLRNPWRFSFDGPRLVIADVGQDMYEEVDDLSVAGARGANFGWSCFEATHPGPTAGASCLAAGTTATPPVFEYDHSGGRCSITGGVVVHDFYLPALAGRYVYGDYCSGDLYSFAPPTTDGGAATGNSPARAERAAAVLVRGRRSGPRLRGLARRHRVPARPERRLRCASGAVVHRHPEPGHRRSDGQVRRLRIERPGRPHRDVCMGPDRRRQDRHHRIERLDDVRRGRNTRDHAHGHRRWRRLGEQDHVARGARGHGRHAGQRRRLERRTRAVRPGTPHTSPGPRCTSRPHIASRTSSCTGCASRSRAPRARTGP